MIRLLIIDDNEDVTRMLKDIFKNKYKVETTNEPEKVAGVFSEFKPEVVLTDYKMPDADGLNMAENIKNIAPEIPIIMMSGYATSELKEEASSLGVSSFLDKPFSPYDLDKEISKVLNPTNIN